MEVQIPVTVTTLKAPEGALDSFTIPSPERTAQADNHDLTDELLITMGTTEDPGTRALAEAAAAAAGGVVAGGLEEAGIYQVRWPSPQNLASKRSTLETQTGVTAVSFSTVEAYGETSAGYPVAEEFDQSEWTWPYEQVDASRAWNLATGSHVTVGVIDEGDVYAAHEDLQVVETFGPGPYSPRFHATHVAGLACARNNSAENGGPQLGMVGMAWGCPIVSTGIEYAKNSNTAMLRAMREITKRPSIKVVNISMGTTTNGCANQQEATALAELVADEKQLFDRLLAGIGKNIVWTFAAGNDCLPAAASPWAANSQLPNVITVAATNSDDGLASFSDYGSEVSLAAPGGVHIEPETKGLMSTAMDGDCPFFDTCPILCDWEVSYCGTYNQDTGTSMAAPVVAGIAALVRDRNPHLTAGEAGECITSTAGTDGARAEVRDAQPAYKEFGDPLYEYDYSMAIVDAAAAVECASGWPTTTEPPFVFDEEFHSTPEVGDTVWATTGSWTHNPTAFAYKWEDCTALGSCTSTVPAASTATYKVTSHDLGYELRAVVTASNNAGSSQPSPSHRTEATTGTDGHTSATATAVSAGYNSTCALLVTGGVDCWGDNVAGELGNGSSEYTDTLTPSPVRGIGDATLLAVGAGNGFGDHACAVLATGAVDCWGSDGSGQLGIGSTTGPETCGIEASPCSSTPVQVQGISDAVDVAADQDASCAVLATGAVKCWGYGYLGQLGDGLEHYPGGSTVPVPVNGIDNAVQISMAEETACAVLKTGSIECWGAGGSGQLGNGWYGEDACTLGVPIRCNLEPSPVSGITDAKQVSLGPFSACATLASGGVECWGENGDGALGNGGIDGHIPCLEYNSCVLEPVPVKGITNATEVTVGARNACASLSSGGVDCWGEGTQGQLGDGSTKGVDTCTGGTCTPYPVSVSGIGLATAVGSGWWWSCAVLSSGSVGCWGENSIGQLGDGTTESSDVPVPVSGFE